MDLGLIFRKKKCQHVWCKPCSKRQKRLLSARLKQMAYKYVRHIVLTLDRKKFSGVLDVYEKTRKLPSYLIQELKRKYKIDIKKYIKILEFHSDGFVHYHIILERDKVKKIGWDIINDIWGLGYVYESYFPTEQDWIDFTGYFDKNGYFKDDKGHQDVLPRELSELNVAIRRFNYSQGFDWIDKREYEKREQLFSDLIETPERDYVRRSNQEIIDTCGSSTRVELFMKNRVSEEIEIKIPFKEIKSLFNCEYKEGVGLYAKCWKRDFKNILKKYDPENDILFFI